MGPCRAEVRYSFFLEDTMKVGDLFSMASSMKIGDKKTVTLDEVPTFNELDLIIERLSLAYEKDSKSFSIHQPSGLVVKLHCFSSLVIT